MKVSIFFLLTIASFLVQAADELPVWQYPILGSEFIGDNCSEETNSILMQISFSPEGAVKNISFLKKSSIQAVNEEAVSYMMRESPFMEFRDMSEEDKRKFSVVNMSLRNPVQKLITKPSKKRSFGRIILDCLFVGVKWVATFQHPKWLKDTQTRHWS
jgi:hypothetical protein